VDVVLKVKTESDLVLVLGSRLGETDFWGKVPMWGDPSTQKMIRVDVDDSILGLNRPAELNILGDIKLFLEMLIEEVEKRKDQIDRNSREARIDELVKMKEQGRKLYDEKLSEENRSKKPMITAFIPKVAREFFGDDAICVVDGGDTAIMSPILS